MRKTSGFAPACLTARATPSKTPFEVTEAPDTASTFKVCPSMISAGIRVNTTSAIPEDSPEESISIFSIRSSETVTSIGNLPL